MKAKKIISFIVFKGHLYYVSLTEKRSDFPDLNFESNSLYENTGKEKEGTSSLSPYTIIAKEVFL